MRGRLATPIFEYNDSHMTFDQALATIRNNRSAAKPIAAAEFAARRTAAQKLMHEVGLDAIVLSATPSLRYFTGCAWGMLERMTGAVLPKNGDPVFIVPGFEEPRLRSTARAGLRPISVPGKKMNHPTRSPRRSSATSASPPAALASTKRRRTSSSTAWRRLPPKPGWKRTLPSSAICAVANRPPRSISSDTQCTSRLTCTASFANRSAKARPPTKSSTSCTPPTSRPAPTRATHSPSSLSPNKRPTRTARKNPNGLQVKATLVLVDTSCTFYHGYHADLTRTYVFAKTNTAR